MTRPQSGSSRRRAIATLAAAGCLVVMAGCGHDSASPQPSSSSRTTPKLASVQGDHLHLTKGWVAAVQKRKMPGDSMDSSSDGASPQEEQGEEAEGQGMDAMGTMSAGYAVIANTGTQDDRLIAASSALAEHIQVHETVSTGGSAGTMKRVDELPVPAGGHATLKPGGYHLMIMGIKHGLRAGSRITIDLKFASGTTMTVPFSVIDRADRPTMSAPSGE